MIVFPFIALNAGKQLTIYGEGLKEGSNTHVLVVIARFIGIKVAIWLEK